MAEANLDAAKAAAAVDPAREPCLVVNPNSAGRATGRKWPELEAEARQVLGNLSVSRTERPMHATELTREALRRGHKLVFAVGGDGTLNEVVNGFFDEDGRPLAPDAAVGILPRGTGGDFRRTAGVPAAWGEALRHVLAAKDRPVDVGRVRFRAHDGTTAVRHFINVASLGIPGNVDAAVASAKWMGPLAFKLASLKALLAWRDVTVRVQVDGGAAEERRLSSLAFGNGRYFGAGMMVAPDAVLDDGLFHATEWRGFGLGTFAFRQGGIYSGAHATWPNTRTFTAKTVTVESDDEVLLDVDGEQPGTLPATFEILPGAIRLRA